MLKTFLARAAFASALLTCGAGPAAAENFDILMMESAFFPEVSIVQPGDTITFINMSNIPRRVKATDNSWGTGNIAENASITFEVIEGMSSTFQISQRGSTSFDNTGVYYNEDDAPATETTTTTTESMVIGSLEFGMVGQLPGVSE